jgi:hypothetical protein
MMKRAIAVAYTMLVLAPAFGGELYIRPERRSIHVGETACCSVRFKSEHYRDLVRKKWQNGTPYEDVFSFYFKPTTDGKQQVGPVTITIGDETLTAPAVPIVVLPDMGKNDFFEIRIYDDQIRTTERIEVIVQSHELKRVPNPYCKADAPGPRPFHLVEVKETADWKLLPRWWNNLGAGGGKDDRGHYIIEGRLEVYEFIPRRTGTLNITRDLFRNLPPDYEFTTKKITVTE